MALTMHWVIHEHIGDLATLTMPILQIISIFPFCKSQTSRNKRNEMKICNLQNGYMIICKIEIIAYFHFANYRLSFRFISFLFVCFILQMWRHFVDNYFRNSYLSSIQKYRHVGNMLLLYLIVRGFFYVTYIHYFNFLLNLPANN